MPEEASKTMVVVVVVLCAKSIAAQSREKNWRSKSLDLGKASLEDLSLDAGGWKEEEWKREKKI